MAGKPTRWLALLIHLLVLRPFLHLAFGLNARGRSNLPERGPFILAANHNSHLDVFVIVASLPLRLVTRTHVVAAGDYFARHRVPFAILDFLLKPVWIDRKSGSRDPLVRMNTLLEAGESIIIFPEGTRGTAGRMGGFQRGVGKLALDHPEAPLLPVYLRGAERAMPRESSMPVPLWQHVTFGPPQRIVGGSKDVTRVLRENIQALERSATAMRHVRRADRGHAPVIAVLGIDGSGKSTLSRRLALDGSHRGRTCLIGDRLELFTAGEPGPSQPLLKEKLRRWVSAQAKDARSLARYKVPKLAELLLRDALLGEARRWYGPDAIFMDGSPILNMTAWSVLYRPELMSVGFCSRAVAILSGETGGAAALDREFPELRVMKRLGLARLKLPDAVIFLDVEPHVAMERIRCRGEKMQVHETEEKLARLREAYLMVVQAVAEAPGLPAVVLDGGRDPEAVVADAVRAVAAMHSVDEEGEE